MIQGWLATPAGAGPIPTIFHMHGGPATVQTESFMPMAQAWLDHGFVFMTINYRGSTTFGRAFQQKIFGDLGHWEVEDMAAARDYLVQQRIAAPDQILLMGGSYGGYLTLMGLGKRPDLWAGGMAQVAVCDWRLMYEDCGGNLKGYCVALNAGTPDERPAQYEHSSPATYIPNLRAPLMVIQGHNDTRCPPRQMRVYEEQAKALGKEIDVHWFDAGHGSLAVEQVIAHQELMLRFAEKLVGSAGQ